MLSLSGIQIRALEAQSPNLVAVVEIATAGGDSWGFVSGAEPVGRRHADLVDYVQAVHSISPVQVSVDPLTRRTTTGKCTIKLVDEGSLREALALSLKNATLTIRVVPAEAPDLANAIPYWAGLIEDIVAEPGLIVIHGTDPVDYTDGVLWRGTAWGRHPLELAELVLLYAGVPSGSIDASAFDPETDTAISHLVIAEGFRGIASAADAQPGQIAGVAANSDPFWAGPDVSNAADPYEASQTALQWLDEFRMRLRRGERPQQGAGAREVLDAVALVCGGMIYTNESGDVTFKRVDTAAGAAVGNWLRAELLNVEQLGGWDNVINQITMPVGFGPSSRVFQVRDVASQADLAPAGASAWVREYSLNLPLTGLSLNWAETFPAPNAIEAADTAFWLTGYGVFGLSGTRTSDGFRGTTSKTLGVPNDVDFLTDFPGGWTQPTNAPISAARPLVLMMDAEIITATAADITDDSFGYLAVQVPTLDGAGRLTGEGDWLPKWAKISSATRGALGTTAADHAMGEWGSSDYGRCLDITAHKLAADAVLQRFAWGMPSIRVESSLALYEYQIGDLVTVEETCFAWYGAADGLSSDLIWEIVGKEIDILADVPRIRWTLALARHDNPPWTPDLEYEAIPSGTRPGGSWGRAGSWYNDAAQTLTKVGAWDLVIEFPDDVLHVQAGWDGSTEYTIQETGLWDLSAGVTADDLAAGGWIELRFETSTDGGSTWTPRRTGVRADNNAGGARDVVATVEWKGAVLNLGELVRVAANVSGTVDTVAGSAYLTIRKGDL